AANEIDGVVVAIAAQEDEEVADPVGHAKAQHALIELRRLLRVRHREGDVPELQRTGAEHLLVPAEVAPVREQRDGRALAVLECENLAEAGNAVIAQLALDPVLGELAAELVEIRIGSHLE